MTYSREPQSKSEVESFSSADPGTIESVIFYADCKHSWWHKLRHDWIRLRGHPETHLIGHSRLYAAVRQSFLDGAAFDLDADTIKISLHADGKFEVD